MTFLKLFFPLDYKRVEQSGPANQKIQKHYYFNILKFIRPKTSNVYYCHNLKGIKVLTRLRLGLSHLH